MASPAFAIGRPHLKSAAFFRASCTRLRASDTTPVTSAPMRRVMGYMLVMQVGSMSLSGTLCWVTAPGAKPRCGRRSPGARGKRTQTMAR